ncbi:MAG: hypothetical protein AAGG75_12685 [Bacteroidota bacterium]
MNKKYSWLHHILNFMGVILGVYLAFYINDRAQQIDDQKERVLLINSMINDLSADIKAYEDYQIPINIQYKASIDSMLFFASLNRRQDMNRLLPTIFQVENYTPTTSTYNSIKSSGKINLLKDLKLQNQLSDYYDGLVIECMKKSELQADFFMEEVVQWTMQNADLSEMKLQRGVDLRLLKNTLLIYQSVVDQKIRNYQMIVETSEQLKESLEAALQSK